MRAVDIILDRQRAWARRCGVGFDSRGYAESLESNLYSYPLRIETRLAFESARGRELRTTAGQGRMRALHSSSALLVNFFEYWMDKDIGGIATALGATQPMSVMKLFPAYPSPFGKVSQHSHIDIEFTGTGRPLLVQSRFAESYFRKPQRFQGQHSEDLYPLERFPACHALLRRILERDSIRREYYYLDVSGLLRHIVGLSLRCGIRGFQLVYLWYGLPSREAEAHKDEIRRFAECLQEEVLFRAISYQELYDEMLKMPGVDNNYLSYLGDRYFDKVE